MTLIEVARDLGELVIFAWLLRRESLHRCCLSVLLAATPTHALERAHRKLAESDLAVTLDEDPRPLLDEARDELARAHLCIADLLGRLRGNTPADGSAPTLPSTPSVPTPRRLQ